jgi:hypothetical protein
MKLNIKAFCLTIGIIWAVAVFLVGIANLIWSGYGGSFLQLLASIYPGYDASPSFGSVIVGTLYALLDGLVLGLVIAWLYNLFAGRAQAAT